MRQEDPELLGSQVPREQPEPLELQELLVLLDLQEPLEGQVQVVLQAPQDPLEARVFQVTCFFFFFFLFFFFFFLFSPFLQAARVCKVPVVPQEALELCQISMEMFKVLLVATSLSICRGIQ